jgi:hypothetical protein
MHATTTVRRTAGLLWAAVALAVACGGEQGPRALRQITDSYLFTITPDQSPPHAREDVLYKVLVRDRESRQPIDAGEGQIFANNRDGASTWDGLAKGREIGTYYGKLNFVTSGDWAIAIRFRRDSTSKLERTDWMQDVLTERQTATP